MFLTVTCLCASDVHAHIGVAVVYDHLQANLQSTAEPRTSNGFDGVGLMPFAYFAQAAIIKKIAVQRV